MMDEKELEVLEELGRSIASAICPPSVGTDETGGTIGSLTEAVMGTTAGLCRVAEAINNLAEAVREGEN